MSCPIAVTDANCDGKPWNCASERCDLNDRSLSVGDRALIQKCAPFFELEIYFFGEEKSISLQSDKMAFGDVKTTKGLEELNNFLADNSYVAG